VSATNEVLHVGLTDANDTIVSAMTGDEVRVRDAGVHPAFAATGATATAADDGPSTSDLDPVLAPADARQEEVFVPSRGCCPDAVSRQLLSGRLPSGRAFPRLLPDGLGRMRFLEEALSIPHPLTQPVPLPSHLMQAIESQHREGSSLIQHRLQVCVSWLQCVEQMRLETSQCHQQLHPFLMPTTGRLNIPFIKYLSDLVDYPNKKFVRNQY
jgi:hypothetical protein